MWGSVGEWCCELCLEVAVNGAVSCVEGSGGEWCCNLCGEVSVNGAVSCVGN